MGRMDRVLWTPERIRALRADATQDEFSARLGVGRVSLARWETGACAPSAMARGLLAAEAARQAARHG